MKSIIITQLIIKTIVGSRPRIGNKMAGAIEIKDNKEFIKNKSSEKARQSVTLKETITFEGWHDKHYVSRYQVGDENGKRDGIDAEVVEDLVKKSLKHLLFYSSRIKGFTFLNHENSAKETKIRIVLQDSYSHDITLNVVIEAHFINFNKYELTIVTAMKINGFNISVGQYVINFIDDDHSVLKKNDVGNIISVFECHD